MDFIFSLGLGIAQDLLGRLASISREVIHLLRWPIIADIFARNQSFAFQGSQEIRSDLLVDYWISVFKDLRPLKGTADRGTIYAYRVNISYFIRLIHHTRQKRLATYLKALINSLE